jgi:predicted metal-binding membrane protein
MTSFMHVGHAAGVDSVASALALVATWFVMMAVMMAPVAWPWVVAFDRLNRPARTDRAVSAVAFIGGYAVAWLLYSIAAALIQMLWLTRTTADASRGLPAPVVALVLAGAGLVQFSPLKRACLTHCRNPFSYLLARWKNGPTPAWRIGLGHGVFCVGCCWALMATMLVVGVVNMWWMLAITVATFVEQVVPRGDLVRPAVGLALIAGGAYAFS